MTINYDIFLPTLVSLGLSEIESKLYIICQQYGASPVSTLARHLNIPRTTVYNYIGNLLQKQILIESKNLRGTLYTAQSPDMIISLLRQQQKKIDTMITDIESIKDTITSLHQDKMMPKIRYYQGKDAILATYEKYSKVVSGFGYFDVAIATLALNQSPEKIAKIFSTVREDIREIIIDNREGNLYEQNIAHNNHSIKKIEKKNNNTYLIDTIYFDGIIHYICYDSTNLVIEIQHPGLYQTQKVFFDQLRDRLP